MSPKGKRERRPGFKKVEGGTCDFFKGRGGLVTFLCKLIRSQCIGKKNIGVRVLSAIGGTSALGPERNEQTAQYNRGKTRRCTGEEWELLFVKRKENSTWQTTKKKPHLSY